MMIFFREIFFLVKRRKDLAPLVHVALRERDVLVGLEVEAARVGLAAAEAADGARGGLQVDDVAVDFFLLVFFHVEIW